MSPELEAIIQAIEGLKQESNIIKDYLLPVVLGFLSALVGLCVAYFTLVYQEYRKNQKEKVNTINEWLLVIEGIMTSLVAIKYNYNGFLTDDPVQRAMKTRSIIQSSEKVDTNISNLAFIIPSDKNINADEAKWRNITRIRAGGVQKSV